MEGLESQPVETDDLFPENNEKFYTISEQESDKFKIVLEKVIFQQGAEKVGGGAEVVRPLRAL